MSYLSTLCHCKYSMKEYKCKYIYILICIETSGRERAEAHQLVKLIAANHGKLPMSMYVELDLDFWGLLCQKLGFLLPKSLMNFWMNAIKPIAWCHQLEFNKIGLLVIVQKYRSMSLENFDCPTGISPLLFSQLWVFHHCKVGRIQSDSVTINTIGQQQVTKKAKQFVINEDGLWGKVWISNTNQPIFVPGNSALTIPCRLGKNTKIPSGTSCLIDTAAVKNLPQGISVNCSLAHPKGSAVPLIVTNQNNHNIWNWQALLTTEFFFELSISHGIIGLNTNKRGII